MIRWLRDPVLEPGVTALVALAAVVYLGGARRLRRRSSGRLVLPSWRVGAFVGGLVVVLEAVASPLDDAATTSLTAHMIQHLLLLVVAPVLLVLGSPARPFLTALGPSIPLRRLRWTRGIWRELTRPLPVFLLYAASLLAWHVPGPYDAAVHHQALHALEHLTFLGTAVLLWMVLLRERPQVPAGMAIGLAMATWVVTASLGALLTFAGAPLYPVYAHATSAWGLSPLRDQRMAGLIMWAPTGLAYIAAAGWRLLRLLAEPDAEGTPPARRTAGTLAGTKGGA